MTSQKWDMSHKKQVLRYLSLSHQKYTWLAPVQPSLLLVWDQQQNLRVQQYSRHQTKNKLVWASANQQCAIPIGESESIPEWFPFWLDWIFIDFWFSLELESESKIARTEHHWCQTSLLLVWQRQISHALFFHDTAHIRMSLLKGLCIQVYIC